MSHKKHNPIPLFSQYLDARIELLETQVKKLNNIFGLLLDLDEEQEEFESEESDEEDEKENCEDSLTFCMELHKNAKGKCSC